MADKDGMERKVYLLPAELVARMRAYQIEYGIASEVEAARRLLDAALQMRDRVKTILLKLSDRYQDEKDLRVLAREVLANHLLITSIEYGDTWVYFQMRTGEAGMIDADGKLSFGQAENGREYLTRFAKDPPWKVPKAERESQPGKPGPAPRTSKQTPPSPSGGWDAPGGSDLDDEIPF